MGEVPSTSPGPEKQVANDWMALPLATCLPFSTGPFPLRNVPENLSSACGNSQKIICPVTEQAADLVMVLSG